MPILFENESDLACPEGELRALAAYAIKYMKLDERVELSILAVNEDEMERLHIEWMDEEGPTDVLSFPIDELRSGEAFVEGKSTLGDIVICPSVAHRQAEPEVATDEQVLEWVRKDGETAYHPSCTCRMGVDEMSVIDPTSMKVRGMEGLRVVDASVMPYVTNGNIYAPVMMLAEKAADLILGHQPLAPEPVEFYRHATRL